MQVSWIRKKDHHLLTVGLTTYSSDERFSATHLKNSEVISSHLPSNIERIFVLTDENNKLLSIFQDWTLQIKYVQLRDAGQYECQVTKYPPISILLELTVVGKHVELVLLISFFQFQPVENTRNVRDKVINFCLSLGLYPHAVKTMFFGKILFENNHQAMWVNISTNSYKRRRSTEKHKSLLKFNVRLLDFSSVTFSAKVIVCFYLMSYFLLIHLKMFTLGATRKHRKHA